MRWTIALAISLVAAACGGKSVGEGGDAGSGSLGGDSAASDGDAGRAGDSSGGTNDASSDDGATTPVTCTPGGGSGSGGPNGCEVMQTETCNGVDYQIDCKCPEGTCTCSGSSGGAVMITSCPTCPTADQAFTLCGLPH
jgi:hypothetical protein